MYDLTRTNIVFDTFDTPPVVQRGTAQQTCPTNERAFLRAALPLQFRELQNAIQM